MKLKPPKGTFLNKGHPLTKGLKLYWIMNEGGGNLVNDLSGNGFYGAMSANLSWTGTIHGPGITTPGGSDYIDGGENSKYMLAESPPNQTQEHVSAMVLFAPTEFNNFSEYALSKQAAAGYSTFAMIGSGNGGIFACYGETSNQVNSPEATGITVTDGNLHMLLGTYDHKFVRLYADGVEQGNGTALVENLKYNVTGDFAFSGCDFAQGNFGGQGDYSCIAVWNRALSAGEVAFLWKYPWCMFDYDPIELWVGSVGAGAPPVGVMAAQYYRRLLAGVA